MHFSRTAFIRLMFVFPLTVIVQFLNPSIGNAEGSLQSFYDPAIGLQILNRGDSKVVVQYIRFNNRNECSVLPFDVDSVLRAIENNGEGSANESILGTAFQLIAAKMYGYTSAFLNYTIVGDVIVGYVGVDPLDSVTLNVGESLLVLKAGECKNVVRAEVYADTVYADAEVFLFEFDNPIQFSQ
jgi:hypothetical protein